MSCHGRHLQCESRQQFTGTCSSSLLCNNHCTNNSAARGSWLADSIIRSWKKLWTGTKVIPPSYRTVAASASSKRSVRMWQGILLLGRRCHDCIGALFVQGDRSLFVLVVVDDRSNNLQAVPPQALRRCCAGVRSDIVKGGTLELVSFCVTGWLRPSIDASCCIATLFLQNWDEVVENNKAIRSISLVCSNAERYCTSWSFRAARHVAWFSSW